MIARLFIGGHHDGQRIDMQDRPVVELPVDIEFSMASNENLHGIPEFKIECYRIEFFSADRDRYTFYRHSSLSPSDCVRRLLENYKPS